MLDELPDSSPEGTLPESSPDPGVAVERGERRRGGPDEDVSRLRVMFVIPGEPVGNSMVFARRQAQSLAGRGIEVQVFYLRSRTSPWRVASEFARFRAHLRRVRPQIIHAHFGTVTALFAALAAPFYPLVITYRGSDLNPCPRLAPRTARLRSWAGRLMSQLAALRAGRIICVSTRLRDQLWWRRERALVYPSGVDENKFLPESQAAARRKLGWPPGGRVALFNGGGCGWIKRPDLARAAVERARVTLPELRLETLDGSVDPELVPHLMNASDCLLLTSETEGSPTVVQEALACNLPIVAFKVGDTEEMLKGVPGTLLVERDIDCISRALIELAGSGKRSQGRNKIGQFSEARIAQALSAVYRELN